MAKEQEEVVIERPKRDRRKSGVKEKDVKVYEELRIEEIDGTFTAVASKKLTFVKQMDAPFSVSGDTAEAGDYYAIDSDGKHFELSAEDLAKDYVPVPEAKRLTHGPVGFRPAELAAGGGDGEAEDE